ncbi:MAG TPA: hypothetical protein VGQ17_02830 [Gemmatimonadales bacterium]|nr:hypothetical protein [Gemmatimonadales bacterium]
MRCLRRSPALRLWRAELAAGVRTTTTFDALWRGACLEIEAEEWDRDGLPERASKLRKLAAALIVAAAERKTGAVLA